MSFKGSGLDDLQSILRAFPRDFTIEDVVTYFEWPVKRAKQAIVNGQQTDVVRTISDIRCAETGGTSYAVYENTQWRKQWITRAWRNREPDLDSQEHRHR